MKQMLIVLQNREIRILIAGRIVSLLGDNFYRIALGIALFHYSGGKSLAISLLWLMFMIPGLIFGAPAGVLAGRLGYRRAMIVADVSRMVLLLVLAALLRPGTWQAVYPLAFAISSCSALFGPATIGILPALVEASDDLMAVNAVSIETDSLSVIVGSAIAGVVAAAGFVTPLLLADAATFAISALAAGALRPRPTEPPTEAEREEAGQGMFVGFRLVKARPLLLFAVAVMVLPELTSGAVVVWLVPFSIRNLHLTSGVGALYTALAVGSLIGGLLAASLGGRMRLDILIAVSITLDALALTVFGVSSVLAVAFLLLVLMGIGESVEYATFGTILQQAVPESYLGQVSGALSPVFVSMMLAGSVLSGILPPLLGLSTSITALGVVTVAVTVCAWGGLRFLTSGQPGVDDLQRIPAFAGLQDDERSWVLSRMRRERFPAGAIVVREGDAGDRFYAIARGTARVERREDGASARDLGPGDAFGEVALVQRVPRTATVRAETALVTYSLSREDFEELQRRSEEFRRSMLESASLRMNEDHVLRPALTAGV